MVGEGHPCFFIAEAGVNHNGDLELARRLVDIAREAGADAVKFQTFQAERVVIRDAPKAEYQKETTGAHESQFEMLRRLQLSEEAHRELLRYCREKNILFLSTPFDEESADFLDELKVPAFKIGSGEVTHLSFLEHVARKGKPVILSTGMSDLNDVESAVRVLRAAGCDQMVLLHCVSSYPADPAQANLRAMQTLAAAFQVPVGYSDHTPGIEVALAAAALGACVIEKHFTLDHHLEGPDHRFSLEPEELRLLVKGIRVVEASLGHGRKEPAVGEMSTAAVARKSLVAARDIAKGTVLTEKLVAIKRPGTGLPPALRSRFMGRAVRRAVPAGTLLTLEMVE